MLPGSSGQLCAAHGVPARYRAGDAGTGRRLSAEIGRCVQDLLYQQSDTGLGLGISAAPSMHVASTWLIARMLQTYYGRWPPSPVAAFLGVILIGSVHLGWHYALDGYVSIAAAWAPWRFTGRLVGRPATRAVLWPKTLPPMPA
ncbi:phosphatase PAP2 family protein [Dongia deserti]|uniref:phosphatase PAP2 family protein n=1 Tax=Dongia deserti TaxID=2268030 RepID=UPI000E64BCED